MKQIEIFLNKCILTLLYLLFLLWISQSMSSPVVWQTSSSFKSGTFIYIPSSSPMPFNSTITYPSPFSNVLRRNIVLGIIDFNFNITDGNFSFQIQIINKTQADFSFSIQCSSEAKIIALKFQYLGVDNSFTSAFSMTNFRSTFTAINSPITRQSIVNFTDSTGVILNTSHENVLLPFMHYFYLEKSSDCVNIQLDFLIHSTNQYKVIFKSLNCSNAMVSGFGFSRIIFDKTQIQALGNSYFDYGIIQQQSISQPFSWTIPPPIFQQNLIFGLHSFSFKNSNVFSFSSLINQTTGQIVILRNITYISIKFSYLHHKKRTCPTQYPYYLIQQILCYDICPFRYLQNNSTWTCDKCLFDCWQCNDLTQCTECSLTFDNRQLQQDINGLQRCKPISGYYSDQQNSSAIKCQPQCLQCQYNGSYCLKCSLTMFLRNNQCFQCSNSIQNCTKCTNQAICELCQFRYQLTSNFTCKAIPCTDINCVSCNINNYDQCLTCMNNSFIIRNGLCQALCGDGQLLPALQLCDDGNHEDGDGCNHQCQIQNFFNCSSCNKDNQNCQNQSLCFYVGQLPMDLIWLYKIQNINAIKIRFDFLNSLSVWSQIQLSSILKLFTVLTENSNEVNATENVRSRLLSNEPVPINYQNVYYQLQTNSLYLQISYDHYNLQGRNIKFEFDLTNTHKLFTSFDYSYNIKLSSTIFIEPDNNQAANWYSSEHYFLQSVCKYIVYTITTIGCLMLGISLVCCRGKLVILQFLLLIQGIFYSLLSLSYMSTQWASLLILRYISGQIWFSDIQTYVVDTASPTTTKGVYLYSSLLQNMIVSVLCLIILIVIGVGVYLLKYFLCKREERDNKQLNDDQQKYFQENKVKMYEEIKNIKNIENQVSPSSQKSNSDKQSNKLNLDKEQHHQHVDNKSVKSPHVITNNPQHHKSQLSIQKYLKFYIKQTNGMNLLGQYTFSWLIYCLLSFTICLVMQRLYLSTYDPLDIILIVLIIFGITVYSILLFGKTTEWKKLFFGEFMQQMKNICCINFKYHHIVIICRIILGVVVMLSIYFNYKQVIVPFFLLIAILDMIILIFCKPYLYGYTFEKNGSNQYFLIKIKLQSSRQIKDMKFQLQQKMSNISKASKVQNIEDMENLSEQKLQQYLQYNINLNIIGAINYIIAIIIYILVCVVKYNEQITTEAIYDDDSIQWTPFALSLILLLLTILNALYLCLQIYYKCKHQQSFFFSTPQENDSNNNDRDKEIIEDYLKQYEMKLMRDNSFIRNNQTKIKTQFLNFSQSN